MPKDNTDMRRRAASDAERRGDFALAADHWRAVVAADPGDGDALVRLATVLTRAGVFTEAEKIYKRLLAAMPGHPILLNNLGMLLRSAGRLDEALVAWQQATRSDTTIVEPLINIGLLLRTRGNVAGAIKSFEQAVARAPAHSETHFQLGHTLQIARQFEGAIRHLSHAASLNPRNDRARFRLCQCYLDTGDFAGFAAMAPFVEEQVAKAHRGEDIAITPWFTLPIRMPTADRRAVARAAVGKIARETAPLHMRFNHRPGPRERVHVGYIAADFRQHALMHLIGGLNRRHNRSRFGISAYAVYAPDDSIYVERLRADVDAFRDISSFSSQQAARTIHDNGVDILVDLSGFTAHARPEILALRPAPIQVSWLGYAGTIGAEIYDYLIADRTVVPGGREAEYGEKIVWMPHSYQINDNEQPIAPNGPSREAQNLPADAFVFACFCQIGRIEKDRYALWMDILRRAPKAVLWLFSESGQAVRNLRQTAESCGIDPARIVFARRLPKPEHLARLRLADLVLDTGTYGAHTTASDALWAGVPFLTCPDDSFASRVGASLLRAIAMPELIADTTEHYRELAVALSGDSRRLRDLADKVAANRLTAPLFDTPRFVQALELAYEAMWRRFEAGLPPAAISIPSEAKRVGCG